MPAFDRIARIPYLPDPLSLFVLLISPLWTFWDPRWNMIRTETRQRRRRKFIVKYRKLYIVSRRTVCVIRESYSDCSRRRRQILQGIAYLCRIVTSLVLHLDLFDSSHALLHGSLLLVTLIVSSSIFLLRTASLNCKNSRRLFSHLFEFLNSVILPQSS